MLTGLILSTAWALETHSPAPGWVVDRWTTDDGLPLAHLGAAAVDADGVVWIATFDGLVRFDGHDFEVLRVGEPLGPHANRLTEILTHPGDGSLWLLSEDLRLQRRDRGDITDLDEAVYGRVLFLPTASTETLWAPMDRQTLLSLDAEPEVVPLPFPLTWVSAEPDGSLVGAWGEGIWRQAPGESWEELPPPPLDSYPWRESTTGALCMKDSEGNGFRLEDGQWVSVAASGVRLSLPPVPSRWGSLHNRVTHDGQPIIDAGWISNLDFDGEVAWVTTRGSGLLRIRPAIVQTHRAPDGQPTNAQRLWWEAREQVLWAQGEEQGWWPVHAARSDFTPLPALSEEIEARCPAWTRRFFIGEDGARWLSCTNWVFRPDGEAWIAESVEGLHQTGPVWQTEAGLLLAGEGESFVRRDGRWQALRLGETPLDGVVTSAVLPDGTVLIGGKDGVLRVGSGEATASPWQTGAVRHIRLDGARLWIATEERGLCVASLQGDAELRCLLSGTIHASIPDDHGRVWVSSNHGLGVLSADGLAAFAGGGAAPGVLWLNEQHGMRSAEANGFVGDQVAKTPDGRLWFPTQDGVVSVDPASLVLPEAPAVLLRSVAVGEEVQSAADLDLPTGHAPVTLRWSTAAIPWVDQLSFRYRLSASLPWSAPTRQRSLSLPSLPPGVSRLEVQALLGDQVGPSTVLRIHRTPALHERSAFPLLVALGVFGALLGGVLGYSRYLARLNRDLEAQVASRTERLERQNLDLNRSNAMLEQQSVALESQNRQLAVQTEALRARNEQIATLAAQLQELDVLKRQLIANLSHELRTPLSLILGPLGDIAQEAESGSRQARHLGLALESAGRLQELINQLFDLSRAQAGGIRLRARHTDLGRLTAALLERFGPLAEQRGVTLKLEQPESPLVAWLDVDLIDKVLANLVSNALRFSPPETTITVRLAAAEGDVRVAVLDEGPGVAPEDRERVFERFFQADASQRRAHDGAGLGLALVRELVELHGGAVGVDQGDVGALFWFTLPGGVAHLSPDDIADAEPVGGPAPPAARPIPEPVAAAEGARVLLVEDHDQLRAYLAESLSGRFAVLTAAGGEEALSILAEQSVSLVITDIMMPGMDGFELVRRIRQQHAELPVIFISARGELHDRIEGLTLADDYLAKPFQVPELAARADALLRRSRQPAVEVEVSPAAQFEAKLAERTAPRLSEAAFNAGALAKSMAMSPRTLQLRMREHGLPTPVEWLRSHRLQQAQVLLKSGEFSAVGEVAAAVGMSHSYFTRVYTAHTGRKPRTDLQSF